MILDLLTDVQLGNDLRHCLPKIHEVPGRDMMLLTVSSQSEKKCSRSFAGRSLVEPTAHLKRKSATTFAIDNRYSRGLRISGARRHSVPLKPRHLMQQELKRGGQSLDCRQSPPDGTVYAQNLQGHSAWWHDVGSGNDRTR